MSLRTFGLALAATVWPACVEPTEIIFDITTDQPCSMLGSTAISVGTLGPGLDTKEATSVSMLCDDSTHSLGRLVVVPSATNGELAVRVVVGVGKSGERCIADKLTGGCIVARRALNFVKHTATKVAIALERSCLDIPCGASETCVRGQCVDARTCAATSCGMTKWKKTSAAPITPRQEMVYGAFQRNVFIWGGYASDGGTRGYSDTGAIYDAASDTWKMLPKAPITPRGNMVIAQTPANDILLWGGKDNTTTFVNGAIYHPASNTWELIPDAPLAPRAGAVAAWATTTNELVIWGGDPPNINPPFADGARYSPMTKAWTPTETSTLSGRGFAVSAWTGASLLVYGGFDKTSASLQDAANYAPGTGWSNPVTSMAEKRAYAFATKWKDKMVVWGGDTNDAPFGMDGIDDGLVLDVNGAQVATIPPPAGVLSPTIRNAPYGVLIDDGLWIWGGVSDTVPTGTGAAYDLVLKKWTAMDASGAPSARDSFAYVWTGTEIVVWGGFDTARNILGDGATYIP